MRIARRSLRLEIIRVNCPADTPCATSACDSARMSAAHCTNVPMSGARRSVDASSCTDSRCRMNRSRSDTTPATLPSLPCMTTCRIPLPAMTIAASPAVAVAGSVIAGVLMTSRIGTVSGRCASTTRSMTSWRVKIPIESTFGIDDRKRTDVFRLHRRQSILQRSFGVAHDGRPARQRRQRRSQSALLGDRRSVLGLQPGAR